MNRKRKITWLLKELEKAEDRIVQLERALRRQGLPVPAEYDFGKLLHQVSGGSSGTDA